LPGIFLCRTCPKHLLASKNNTIEKLERHENREFFCNSREWLRDNREFRWHLTTVPPTHALPPKKPPGTYRPIGTGPIARPIADQLDIAEPGTSSWQNYGQTRSAEYCCAPL
jgi:hypothetical protein